MTFVEKLGELPRKSLCHKGKSTRAKQNNVGVKDRLQWTLHMTFGGKEDKELGNDN